ncbi:MAG: DoxX family membrane protein [Cyclobacteriaceae bacterium]
MQNKILAVLCVPFGLVMVNSGLNKFFNYMPMPDMTEEMMQCIGEFVTIKWFFPLVAIVEIIAGTLIVFPKTRALGALLILPVMVGIFVHYLVYDLPSIGMSLVFLAINFWAIIANLKKYLPIVD